MSTLVIGIRPGTRNAGVSVCIDGDVLEAVTVEGAPSIPKPALDPATGKAVPGNPVTLVDTTVLVALAGATWQAAIDIVRDHADTIRARCTNPRPLVVVEALVPSKRATVGRGRALETVIAQSITQGALAAVLADEDLVLVASDEFGKRDPDWYPDVLNGPQPQGWRGRKGSDREVQRAAWAIAQAGLAARNGTSATPATPEPTTPSVTRPQAPQPAAPATPQEFVAAIRQVVRNTSPDTPADVLAAARHALTTVHRPAGVPDLTPQQVAVDAVTRAGVAPHLNTTDGLTALAESAGM